VSLNVRLLYGERIVAKRKLNPDFDVALSFAGEDRAYVEEVASVLREMGLRVFYDKYETVSLWGKDLYTHLREIYFSRARYTGDERRITKSSKIIEITYEPLLNDFGGNATGIMVAIFDLLFSSSCKDCADIAIATLDLSVLSTLAGLEEVH